MKSIVFMVVILSLIGVFAYGQSSKELLRDGNKKYKSGKYDEAEVLYRKALAKEPNKTEGVYNLGNSLYKQGKYTESTEKYTEAIQKGNDPQLQANSYYNLGNSYLKNKQYKESIDYYKKALKLNPKDYDAKYNLEYARRMLAVQQQQQQQNQNSKNQPQNQQQNQQNQSQQDNQQKQNRQQSQTREQKISNQNIDNILNALRNEEKKTQKEVKAKLIQRSERRVEKNW
jgi:tetratricopeptide (TPR) repeat protein